MNLTGILKHDAALEDHSLVDHSWWSESGLSRIDDPILNIDTMRNPNNVKPQLEAEWGLGGPTIDFDEPAGIVERNLPEDSGYANSVILFARDMFNRGYRGKQVVAALKSKYPQELLGAARSGLRNMFALEGLVGRIMVDARGYRNCRDAVKAASNSPYKGFVKFVYGCDCGTPHMMPYNEENVLGQIQDSSGNAMDDFLTPDRKASKRIAHCQSTMLPILASMGDLDKSLLDGTLIEMMNLTPVPEGVVEQIRAMKTSNLAKIRSAFRWLDKHIESKESSKYAGKVDASDFIVDQCEDPIDVIGIQPEDMDVDGTNPSLMTDVEPNAPVTTNFDGMNNLTGIWDDVGIDGPVDMEQIPVELMDERGGVPVPVNPMLAPVREKQVVDQYGVVDLDVDFFSPGNMDISLDGETEIPIDAPVTNYESLNVNPNAGDMEVAAPSIDDVDVDFAEELSPIFQGVDEIVLDETQELEDEIPVNMSQDQDIEL